MYSVKSCTGFNNDSVVINYPQRDIVKNIMKLSAISRLQEFQSRRNRITLTHKLCFISVKVNEAFTKASITGKDIHYMINEFS